ncbi:MAG: hypothetical protein ACKPKO_13735, partial [Candidatus Fonsibacter sp.]
GGGKGKRKKARGRAARSKSKQRTRTKTAIQYRGYNMQLNKQHGASRKALTTQTTKTIGRAHGQLRLDLTKHPTRFRPTLSNQDGGSRQEF